MKEVACPSCGELHDATPLIREHLESKTETIEALEEVIKADRRKITALQSELADRRLTHKRRDEAEECFEHWKKLLAPRAKEFAGKRFDTVIARLNAGHSVADIKKAIEGCAKRPYVSAQGRTVTGRPDQRQVELELICRDEDRLTRFQSYADPDGADGATNGSPVPGGPSGSSDAIATPHQLAAWSVALRPFHGRLEQLRGWAPEIVQEFGLGMDGSRVVIPAPNAQGVVTSLVRYAPNSAERRGPKTIAEGERNLFPRPELFDCDVIWLVEGEGDALALASIGMNAVGVPGVNTWKAGWAHRFERFGRVIVCFDCDEHGRESALARQRSIAEVTGVAVYDLAGERDDGYDVSDLIVEARNAGKLDKVRPYLEANALVDGPSAEVIHMPRSERSEPPRERGSEDPLGLVVTALEARGLKVKGKRPKLSSRCPVHNDRHASMSLGEGDDGRVLLHCHVGCEPGAIMTSLGLDWTDAFKKERSA